MLNISDKKGCNRRATASDKVYQLLAHGRWFSLGNPASSTIKTGRHDIAEILLKVVLSTQKKSKNINVTFTNCVFIVMKTLPNDYSRHWDKKKSINFPQVGK
jgi:hypothetical protein